MIHLPELNYDCVGCGRSCTAFEVEVRPQELLALQASPVTRQVEQAGWLPLRVRHDRYFLGKQAGHCSYLSPGDPVRCRLHETHGWSGKPQTCRDFPFHTVRTPEGTFVGLSFVCTAVAMGSGRPLEAHREELSAQFGQGLGDAGDRWALWEHLALDWPGYKNVEAYLQSGLDTDTLTLQVARLARAVRDGNMAGLKEDWTPTSAWEKAAAELVFGLLTLIETAGAPMDDQKTARLMRAVSNNQPYFSQLFDTEVEAIDRLPLPDWYRSEERRYLNHFLFRKSLLGLPNVLARSCLLSLLPEVLQYLTRASAASRKHPVERVDFQAAVRALDGRLIVHASGGESYFSHIASTLLARA